MMGKKRALAGRAGIRRRDEEIATIYTKETRLKRINC